MGVDAFRGMRVFGLITPIYLVKINISRNKLGKEIVFTQFLEFVH